MLRADTAKIDRKLAIAHAWQRMCPGKLAVFGTAAFWVRTGRIPILVPDEVCVLYLGGPDDVVPDPLGGFALTCTEMQIASDYWFDTRVATIHGIQFYRPIAWALSLQLRLSWLPVSFYCFAYTDASTPVMYYPFGFDVPTPVFNGIVKFNRRIMPDQEAIVQLLQKCRITTCIGVD